MRTLIKKYTASSVVNDVKMYQEALTPCKMDTDKKWTIIEFETDAEDKIERFQDLSPSKWISSNKTLSWYPMGCHKATIQKLAKQCAEADPKWDCFSIKVIEENIGTYF